MFANLFVNFLLLLCVLDPLVSCPLFLYCLSLAKEQPEAELASAAQAGTRLFLLISETDGWAHWFGSFNKLPGQSSLSGSRSCTSALEPREVGTFFYVHLNASHSEPKSFSSNPITHRVKARLAVCLLITL